MIDSEKYAKLQSLYEFYKNTLNQYKDNTFDGDDLTYAKTFEIIKERAGYLQQAGYRKGDVVGILSLNSPEWLISYMALTSIGIIALPLDTNLNLESYQTMLEQVDAKGLFVSEDFKLDFTNVEVLDISMSECRTKDIFKEVDIIESDIATFLYTSGTTGKPKIVQLTHGNMYKGSIGGNEFVKVKENSLVLCMLPFYHIFGLHSTFLACFGVGSGYVCQPSLTAPAILQSLKDYDITVFPAVPQLWEMMLDGILNKVKTASKLKYSIFMFNLKHAHILKMLGLGFIPRAIFKPVHKVFGEKIDFLITGGAPFKKEYYHYYYNMGFKVMEGYGLTETTSAICASNRDKYKPGQSGPALPGNEMKLKDVNDLGIGEIWFRGHNVFPGYYKNPEATAEVFDKEGWFNSGDLGFIDKYGEVHVTGREKNLIVLDSGKNVYPEELESYYSNSPLVGDIAVFGQLEGGREIAYAVIVPKKLTTTYSEIKADINRLNKGLPSYKKISDFAITTEVLPKTTKRTNINSKIIKNLQAGLYNCGETEAGVQKELLSVETRKSEIIVVLKDELKRKQIYNTQILSDFNIDSLGIMNLIVQLEVKLEIKIEEKDFTGTNNLEELVNYLSSCPKGEGRTTFDELIHGNITTKSISFFNPLFELLLIIFRFISKVFWRAKVYKKEKLDFNNSIVAVNHQSIMDILILLSSLSYKVRKDMFITAKKELKFLKYIFPGISYIFVDRKNSTIPALKAGADILRQGKTLVIFPEGTRTKDGRLSEFKTGAVFLAKELKKSIIPMTINGAYKVFPTNTFFPKFFTKHRVSLTILKRLNPENYLNSDIMNKALFKAIKGGLAK
ncbi:MAG: AMP-binding protein [Spirochaetaceae bacterium]